MPENLWYVATDFEILIDTDNANKSFKHFSARLGGAIECEKLDVRTVESHPSARVNHMHTLITLSQPMEEIERAVWAIILHSDIYRGCANIMRSLHGVKCPDLLITPIPFSRNPDGVCHCEGKHNAEIMFQCPAAISFRGEDRIKGFFGKPKKL